MNRLRKICCLAVALASPGAGQAFADQSWDEARVTRVIRQVELVDAQRSAVKPAAVEDKVAGNTAVRTGDESRSELTFKDLTITRLGQNTIFTFNKAGRDVQLNAGSVLLYVPKNSGGAHMSTDAVSVAITGSVVILDATPDERSVVTVLEDGARVSLIKHPKESVFVREGQMVDVPAGAIKMPKPANIDLRTIMTSPLITDFPPLPIPDLASPGTSKPPGRKSRSGGGPAGPSGPGGPVTVNPVGGGTGPVVGPGQPGGGTTVVVGPGKPKKPKKPKTPKGTPTPTPTPGGGKGNVGNVGAIGNQAGGVIPRGSPGPTKKPPKRFRPKLTPTPAPAGPN